MGTIKEMGGGGRGRSWTKTLAAVPIGVAGENFLIFDTTLLRKLPIFAKRNLKTLPAVPSGAAGENFDFVVIFPKENLQFLGTKSQSSAKNSRSFDGLSAPETTHFLLNFSKLLPGGGGTVPTPSHV